MPHEKPLPPIRKLKKLAEWDGPYPIKSYRLVIGAQRYGFDDETIKFLQLFPREEVFNTRNDFIESCQALEQAILSERDNPEYSDIENNVPAPIKKDVLHAAFRLFASARSSVAGLSVSARHETWY